MPKASYVPEPKPVRSKYEIGAFYFPGFPTAEPVAADPRLSQPQADSRLVRRVEPRVRRLADQVGRRARHQFLHGRLVLVPGQSPLGALAPQCLRQGPVPQVSEMGRHVGEPQSAEHAFRGGLAQGHAVLDRPLLQHAGVLPHRQPARRVHLGAGQRASRSGRKQRGGEALRHVAGDGQSRRIPGHLLRWP